MIRSLALASSIALMLIAVPSAVAQENQPDLIGGGKAPAGWAISPEIYDAYFGPLNVGAPQGTLVADSGFRPYPNGFPVPNWGDPQSFINNQFVFGVPERVTLEEYNKSSITPPKPLNALSLRRTFGDGVCRDPKAIDPTTGDCELIFGAELMARMIETSSRGGHCFGFAAAAAALYNGQLPASQVGASGLGVNAANQMRQPAVQSITRLFGTQYFNSTVPPMLSTGMSPTEVVTTLRSELAGGTTPYVLTLLNDKGGHGITPFAVLDRGDGLFDIAVYDNNYPLRARAITVNTTTDTFSYSSAINPTAPGIEWSSETQATIGLVSVADLLTEQTCPVCLGPDQGTLVTLSSLKKENASEISLSLIDEAGQPLDRSLWRETGSLNPPTQDVVSQPVITVAPGVRFGVKILTGNLASEQSLEVFAISNGEAQYVLLDKLASNSGSVFGVGGSDGSLFVSSAPSSPRILQLSDQPGMSFDVNGHPLNLPADVRVDQRWNTATERVEYKSNAKKTLRWNIQVGGLDDDGGREYVGLNVRVPAGAKIVVDYTKASATVPPKAWVKTADGDRRPVSMQPVTKQLINAYRDEIYVSTGLE